MEVREHKFLDAPEVSDSLVGLIYGCVAFSFAPFILIPFRLALELDGTIGWISWLEIALHVLSFLVVVPALKDFLQGAWWTVETKKKSVILTALASVVMMLCMASQILRLLPDRYLWIGYEQIFPMVEAVMYMTPSYAATCNPIFATIAMVVLVPVVNGCIYYVGGFIHAFNRKPWLGYLSVAVVSAVLTAVNSLIWKDPMDQLVLYLCRLPMHFICCWALQKTDTVWTPIIAQATVNLISCLFAIFLY